MAQALGSVTDMAIAGHLPVVPHARAVRGPAGVHRVPGQLRPQLADAPGGRVPPPVAGRAGSRRAGGLWGPLLAPTLITFGRHDQVTSTRFLDPLTQGIGGSTEVTVFEDCARAPIYENVEAFNQRTLEFLHHHPA